MTRRYRATKLRTTLQRPIGEPVEEKVSQLYRLRLHIVEKLYAGGWAYEKEAENHEAYRQAQAFAYENISAYFAMVDEEVRQRGERADLVPVVEMWHFPTDGGPPQYSVTAADLDNEVEEQNRCVECHIALVAHLSNCWVCDAWRMRKAKAAFAELGRIVGEAAFCYEGCGRPVTGCARSCEACDSLPEVKARRAAVYDAVVRAQTVLTETAPAKATTAGISEALMDKAMVNIGQGMADGYLKMVAGHFKKLGGG